MQELVHRNCKEFIIAPKTASTGKAEQYVMPSKTEHLSGLPKSSLFVRNVDSIARRRRDGMAQLMARLSDLPCGLRDFVFGWYRNLRLVRSWVKSVLVWSLECVSCNHLYFSGERSVGDMAAPI